jgi:hypothetical protein
VNVQAADYLVHFSNILLLVAYSVRDILWLRWFAVAAALTNIPYFLLQGTVLWPPVLWALVFTAMNLYQIARLYLERRPVVLSEDEQKLYDLGFIRFGRASLFRYPSWASGKTRNPASRSWLRASRCHLSASQSPAAPRSASRASASGPCDRGTLSAMRWLLPVIHHPWK